MKSAGIFLLLLPLLATASVPQSFSTLIPGRNPQDSARLLASDPWGNLFVVFSSPKTSAVTNIHIVKTDPTGKFLASFDFGGTGIDTPNAAAVDPQGNLIVVGATESPDFPLVSPLLTTGAAFATKIDAQLGQILFSTRLGSVGGGPLNDGASAVALDGVGNIYITGSTSSGFPTTPGVLQSQAPVPSQAAVIEHGFVTELSNAGDRVVFATYFSGAAFNCAAALNPCTVFEPPTNVNNPLIATTLSAIAVDAGGAVTIAGTTNASNLPVSPNAYSPQCGCNNLNSVAFIARIAPGGTQLEWGTYLPLSTSVSLYAPSILGVPLDTVASIALDSSGNVLFAGTAAQGFPITTGALQPAFPSAPGNTYAGFLAKLDSTGSKLLFSTWLGGATSIAASSGPAGMAIDSSGTIGITGGAAIGSLPAPTGTPLLGEDYIAGIAADGTSVLSLYTVPDGGAGEAIQATEAGTIAALGTSGALLVSSATSGPSLLGVAGSVSYRMANALAPRELISLYGIGIGPSTSQNASITGGVIANSLAGVQVLFDGIPAALLYAGPTQINAIIPSALAGSETTALTIVTPTGIISGPTFPVVPTLPQVSASLYGFANAMNQDGTQNSVSNPALPGSVVSIWLIGGGAQTYTPDNTISTSLRGNPYPVSILANNPQSPFPGLTSLEVLYAGDAADQPSGMTQVNFLLPTWPTGDIFQVQVGDATTTFSIYAQ